MFQELLVADLVVADLTLTNPNVWYELGVRHALRARGVVLICGGKVTTAFDLYTDRKLRYSIKDGGPDPTTLESDRKALTAMVTETMNSWKGRKISPVYQLLPNLQEPDWKSFRIGDVREFWERHDAWKERVEGACRARSIGDALVLADEAPVAAFRADAWIAAGKALRGAERFKFALEQLERGLEVDPQNLDGLREQGICLQRLALLNSPGHSLDKARAHYDRVLKQDQFANDPEIWALLARVDKDAWIASWRVAGKTTAQMREEAAYEDALLRAAIASYANGYRRNQGHYYSGINALTLMHLYRHLTDDTRYDAEAAIMAGAVRFAAQCAVKDSFYPTVTIGDLEVLIGTPDTVKNAYKDALATDDKGWFALNSSVAQLQILKDLDFRPENVDAGIATFKRALQKMTRPEDTWQARQVLLFSGHMIDAPGRTPPRFPADKEPIAAQKIAEVLEQLGAGPDDIAFTQGACGGDLLFTEAALKRGVKVQWLQPFDEPEFIEKSVVRCSEAWRKRYLDARAKLPNPPRSTAEELGDPPPGAGDSYPYERCNLWLLYSALAQGIDKVRFICLWNGAGGDGPGGTEHMYNEVKRRTGQVTWLDTRTLW